MAETEWTSVKIPKRLTKEIEGVLPETSFRNVSHFVDVAVREKLKALEGGAENGSA